MRKEKLLEMKKQIEAEKARIKAEGGVVYKGAQLASYR